MADTRNYRISSHEIGVQRIGDTSTAQNHELGKLVSAKDTGSTAYGSGMFIYAKGVASTVVGSVVLFDQDGWTTSLATANDKGMLGVAMSANVASQYGWYQVVGKGVAKVAASFADNGDCYLTSTDGTVDDAVVAGDYIRGMKGASAIDTPATGLAEVELFWPSVKDGLDDATA